MLTTFNAAITVNLFELYNQFPMKTTVMKDQEDD